MAISKAKRVAAAKKAARTRKRNERAKIRKKAAKDAVNTIKTKGSSEDFSLKIEVMGKFTKYSKGRLMCKCCKKYFLPHFFNMDHIHGRKEISKIKELKKIDYNQKRGSVGLLRWINKHVDKNKRVIFKHFQPLCWNCNIVKHLYKTCPHQRK